MRAGEMRHRVQVYRPSSTKDEYGEAQYVLWNKNVYCAAKAKDASEQVLGSEYSAATFVDFKIRYSRSVEMEYQDMIILFRGKEFQITGVRNIGFMDKELMVAGVHFANQQRLNL